MVVGPPGLTRWSDHQQVKKLDRELVYANLNK